MSGLTLPLWRVLELNEDPGNGRTIGLDEYPIFDEGQRDGLNRLIIDHFYLREIGQETISIFTFMLRRTMREIMPTYNQLYRSSAFQFDPLSTYALNTVRNGTAVEQATQNTTGSSTDDSATTESATQHSASATTGDSTGTSRSVFFDTPQTALSGNKDYAANATDANSESKSTGSSTGDTNGSTTSSTHATASTEGDSTTNANSSNTDTSTTTGRQGSANRLLAEYRSNIINIDLLLLNDPELTTMFMGVWDDGEEITPPRIAFNRPGRLSL